MLCMTEWSTYLRVTVELFLSDDVGIIQFYLAVKIKVLT